MKKIIIMAALIALAFSVTAAEPVYQSQNISGTPTTLAAATNLATPVVIDCRRQRNVAIAMTIAASTAGQTNTLTFCRSLTGSATANFDTNSVFTVTVLANPAGGARTTVTNLAVEGVGYLVLTRIAPTGTDTITNSFFAYGVKSQSP